MLCMSSAIEYPHNWPDIETDNAQRIRVVLCCAKNVRELEVLCDWTVLSQYLFTLCTSRQVAHIEAMYTTHSGD